MTRHVVANAQVTHLWANQSQDWARGPSISFNGNYLSSYRTVIARLMPEIMFRDKPVCLISENHWGVTTAKHIHYAHNAIRRYHWEARGNGQHEYVDDTPWHVFNVDQITGPWGHRDVIDHERNIMVKFAAYERRCEAICKPRITWGYNEDTLDKRLRLIFEASHDYREYAQCFNVQEPYPNFDYWVYKCRQAWAKYWDPKTADRREAQHAADRLRQARTMAWVHAYGEGVAPKPHIAHLPRRWKRDAESIVRTVHYREHPNEHRAVGVTPEEWIMGKGSASQYWGGYQMPNATLLRRKGDSVQTSRGAEVPWADALRAWAIIQRVRCKGQEYVPNGLRHGVGGFTINKIEANGRMTIGCHVLEYGEMLRLALHDAPESVIACYPVPAQYAGDYRDLPMDPPTLAHLLAERPKGFKCGDEYCSYCGDKYEPDNYDHNGSPVSMDLFDIQPGEE